MIVVVVVSQSEQRVKQVAVAMVNLESFSKCERMISHAHTVLLRASRLRLKYGRLIGLPLQGCLLTIKLRCTFRSVPGLGRDSHVPIMIY